MANQGKTISQYSLTSTLQTDDELLLQRGNEYLRVKAQSLTTGASLSVTYAAATTLKTATGLETGAIYYLSDKYVYIQAIGGDKFNLTGVFYSRNADFQSTGVYAGITIANGFTVNATATNLGVWTSALAPASGDVAIWNNLHWLNITGVNGASNPPADAVNWEAVPNTDILVADTYGYIYEYDAIEYDFDNDTILRRVDLRSNDIAENSISVWQWGDDNVTSNSVFGEATVTLINILGIVRQSTLFSNVTFDLASGNTVTGLSMPWYNSSITSYVNAYDGTSDIRGLLLNHADRLDFYLIGGLSVTSGTIDARNSTLTYDIELTATAYNGATTYTFGDFMTAASVTYMYINSVDASGNAAPNVTYWQEVFDVSGGAGTHKLTISKYFNCAGEFVLDSSAGTETIDEIVYDSDFPSDLDIKFSCDTTLVATFDNTLISSLASAGEIIASGNIAVDGAQYEFVVFEKSSAGGFVVMREKYSQTGIA
jgi:hypothetical protein